MNEPDPYAPPESEPPAVVTHSDSQFSHLEFAQLKKIYYRSCNVNAITVLLILGTVFLLGFALMPDNELAETRPLLLVLSLFYGASVAGLVKRTSWGRILGIIVCILALINIPLGTLIGIFGLFAFFGAPELFGRDRVLHKDLKAAFKIRKVGNRTSR